MAPEPWRCKEWGYDGIRYSRQGPFFLWHFGDIFESKKKLCPTASIAKNHVKLKFTVMFFLIVLSVTIQNFKFVTDLTNYYTSNLNPDCSDSWSKRFLVKGFANQAVSLWYYSSTEQLGSLNSKKFRHRSCSLLPARILPKRKTK